MASTSSLTKRVERLEVASGIGESLPTLFLTVYDASTPDPDLPETEVDLTDSNILGVIAGSQRISRRPGESFQALEKRAAKLLPDCRLFICCYRSLDCSLQAFERATEIGA